MKITKHKLSKFIRETLSKQERDPRFTYLASLGWKVKPSANFPARIRLPSDPRVGLDIARLDGVWWLEAYIVDSKGNNRYPGQYGDKWLANEHPPSEGSDDPMYDHFIKSGYINAMTAFFLNLDRHADLLQDEDYASTIVNLTGNELLETYDLSLIAQVQDDFIKLTGINQ